MKKLIFTLLIFTNLSVMASVTPLHYVCQTPRESKVFEVTSSQITFYQDEIRPHRSIASEAMVLTKRRGKSLTKTWRYEGQSYRVFMKDVQNPSEIDDFISIKTAKGHEITYPITCKSGSLE